MKNKTLMVLGEVARSFFIPVLVLLAVSFTSCGNLNVHSVYVSADRATFDAIAPVIRNLSDEDPSNDPNLSGVNGQALGLTIQTWEARLLEAEKQIAQEPGGF